MDDQQKKNVQTRQTLLRAAAAPHLPGLPKAPEPLERYLVELMHTFTGNAAAGAPVAGADVPRAIFAAQTRREFCYLSQSRVQRYSDDALAWIGHWVQRGEPVRYYLDIGGGYHASLRPGIDEVSFDIGLAHLLLLAQIRRFDARVRAIHAPGVRFTLVIDNLCALLINDIGVSRTAGFCAQLRALIESTGMSGRVDLFVESEQFAPADFERLRGDAGAATGALTAKEHETVTRFLGRACDAQEAAQRAARYREITGISDRLINQRVEGLRMTQRATSGNICFRAYPGGDSRIQSGQVALRVGSAGQVSPVLLTSHNEHEYDWHWVDTAALLPAGIDKVICAVPGAASASKR